MASDDSFGETLPGSLPSPLTPLIGREREVAAARDQLTTGGARLLTMTGPGGVGKTRLAIEVARTIENAYPDGVRFAPLAPLTDPELVVSAIARALDVADSRPPLVDRVQDSLRGRRLLLVLDNFEHVLPAAPLVTRLLTGAGGLAILATSRAALRLSGEHVLAVSPLPVPGEAPWADAASVWENPSVRLFVTRARAAWSDVPISANDCPAIAAICRRLDGLPLAIELAAAKTPILSPQEVLTRLERRLPLLTGGPRDVPDRLRTMRDAIAWSFDLLDPEHQALFRRLSVFAGGFALDGAAAMVRGWAPADGYPFGAGQDVQAPWWLIEGKGQGAGDEIAWNAPELPPLSLDVVDGVETLLRQSLLRPTPHAGGARRFEMLETIREFGLEQLEAAGEAEAVRHAHAAYLVGFAEAAEPRLWGAERRNWLERVEDELANVRVALGWLSDRGETTNALAMRMLEALWAFWYSRGHIAEGRAWLEAALARGGAAGQVRAGAENVAGFLAWAQGDDRRATDLIETSLATWRGLGHNVGIGRSLFFRALVAWRQGDYALMAESAEEALRRFKEWEDGQGTSVCLIVLGIVQRALGNTDQADALFGESLAMSQGIGFGWGTATARYYAGETARTAGDLPRAASLLGDGLDRYWEQGDPWGAAGCISGLACIASARNEPEHAARLFGTASALAERASAFLPPTEQASYEQEASRIRAALGDAAFAAAYAAGRVMAPEAAIAAAKASARQAAGIPPDVESPQPSVPPKLTRTEREVLDLLIAGKSAKEIATIRSRSPSTVYEVLARIRAKLGTDTDAESAAVAVRLGLN